MSRKPKAGTHLARMLDREYAAELGRLYLLNNQDDLHPALRGAMKTQNRRNATRHSTQASSRGTCKSSATFRSMGMYWRWN